jgi:hypothetical protein
MSTPTPPDAPTPAPQITVDERVEAVSRGHVAGVNINALFGMAMVSKTAPAVKRATELRAQVPDARREILQTLNVLEELGDQHGVEDARRQLSEWEEHTRSQDCQTQ